MMAKYGKTSKNPDGYGRRKKSIHKKVKNGLMTKAAPFKAMRRVWVG